MKTNPLKYYAVIFTNQLKGGAKGYEEMAQRMSDMAAQQKGYLGMDSVRGEDGLGITISYWETEDAISLWKRNADHQIAQEFGKMTFYHWYDLKVCEVIRAHRFEPSEKDSDNG